MPLGTPQTPKPSLSHVGHYEDLRVMDNLLEDPLSEEKLKELNLFPEIEVNKEKYKQMDYFLPSKGLDTVYSHRHGINEDDEINFRKVFPCPQNSLWEEVMKHMEREKIKEREKLHGKKTRRLKETLSQICNCPDPE